MTVDRIEKLKEMFLNTDLREGAEIVSPPGPEWKSVTDRLRGLIRAHAGLSLPVASGETSRLSGLNDRHRVILGSAMNNPALMALYRRRYAFVDDFYPGGDGYAIQTVHNPECRGHNVLLIGASRPEGAAAGLERLGEVLKQNGGRFGYTNLARSTTHKAILPDTTPEAFRERTEAAFRENTGVGVINSGITYGMIHHFTHDPDCARMFKDVLLYYEDLVRNRYDGEWCFEHMLFIYSWTWRLFYVWDLIEESDAFTDAERLRMANLLWGLTNYVAGLPYFRGEEPPVAEIRQNHPTFAALSMSFSAGYFKTYYGIGDFEKHLRFSQAIFDGQAPCYKPNDDGGGGGYCWLVPNHQMTYDLVRDDFRFLEGGHLRGIADYAILMTDNLGSPVDFGDVGTYSVGRRHASFLERAHEGVASVLCKAAWYYEDGGYLWALDWMGGAPRLESYYKDLPRRMPDRMVGIAIAPFNRPLYEWVERRGPGGTNVPLEEAFDKLVLRKGFNPEDEYLFLDGTSTFAHGHEDGNSIERLTWKGRMWLAETDYIWKRPRHHSSVVSICDGESFGMPSLAALKWAEDFGGVAFTRTAMPGYNGTDWARDLFWVKGRYILAADSLKLLKDADYDLRCLWRTLGDARLEGDGLRVEQKGVFFRIRNADDSAKSLEVEEPRIAGQDPYKGYEYAQGPIRIFKQRKALHGKVGDVERYFNLMIAGTEAEADACRVVRVAEGVVRVEGTDGATVFGLADQETGVGQVRVTAGAFALADAWIALLHGTRLTAGEVSFESGAPVHLILYPGEGRGEVRVQAETTLTVRGLSGLCFDGRSSSDGGARLSPGAHRLTFRATTLRALSEAVRSGAPHIHRRGPRQNRFAPKGLLRPAWETALEGRVRCMDARDWGIAAGTSTGQVALLGREGRVQWTHGTGAEVRTVHLTELEGEGALLAGGRDCALTRFGVDGTVRWRREFIPSHRRDQIVNAVTTADLTGDGKTEVVVATDGWLVWALTPEGEEVWQRQIEHHAAQTLVIADVEGDGRREVLVGTEYHTSNMLEADGKIRWTVRGGPCFTALALADLNGDGIRESVYGAMDGNVYVLDSTSGKTLWTANLGDDVRHGLMASAGGEIGLVAGSESGNVAWLSPEGKKRWRRDLDAPVTGLAPFSIGDRRGLIAVGTSEGWIVLLSLEGEVLGGHRMKAGVTALGRLDLAGGPGLLVGTDSGLVTVLTQGG